MDADPEPANDDKEPKPEPADKDRPPVTKFL